MKNNWELIENKLKEIAPSILESLNIGATDENIKLLEKTINSKLPDSFVNFYKIHNGQDYNAGGLLYCNILLSIDNIVSEWSAWKRAYDNKSFNNKKSIPSQGIKDDWWNPLWIPITSDGSGANYCLDLSPTEEGNYGQVIYCASDDKYRSLEADSFEDWITNYANKLNSGQLVYSDEYDGILDKDDL